MVTLLITRGYPASGKSTLARKYVEENDNWARMNRDDLRFNMYGKYHGLDNVQEDRVTIAQVAAVTALLTNGVNVVVDDTNLNARSVQIWKNVRYEMGCDFVVVDVTTSLEECIKRDINRFGNGERWVGQDVIHSFARRYPMPWART